jgi:hypothetical protein
MPPVLADLLDGQLSGGLHLARLVIDDQEQPTVEIKRSNRREDCGSAGARAEQAHFDLDPPPVFRDEVVRLLGVGCE